MVESKIGAGTDELGPRMPSRSRRSAMTPKITQERRRVASQFDEVLEPLKRVPKEKASAIERAEEVAHHWKRACPSPARNRLRARRRR